MYNKLTLNNTQIFQKFSIWWNLLYGIQKRNVHFNLLKHFKDFKILIHFLRWNQPLGKGSRDRTPFNFIRFRLKDLITTLYFGRFILCIAFRNIFFNDISTTKSSYRFSLTYFIFKGTTIINKKLTWGFGCGWDGNLPFSIVLIDMVNLVRVLLMSFLACEFWVLMVDWVCMNCCKVSSRLFFGGGL